MAGETNQAAAYSEQRAQSIQEQGNAGRRARAVATDAAPRRKPAAVREIDQRNTDRYYAAGGARTRGRAQAPAPAQAAPPRSAAPAGLAAFVVGGPETANMVVDAAITAAVADGVTVTVQCANRRAFSAARTRLDLRGKQPPPGYSPGLVKLVLQPATPAPAPAADLPPVSDTAETRPWDFLRSPPAEELPADVAQAIAEEPVTPAAVEDTDDESAPEAPAEALISRYKAAPEAAPEASPGAYEVPDLLPADAATTVEGLTAGPAAEEPAAPVPRPQRPGRRSNRGS